MNADLSWVYILVSSFNLHVDRAQWLTLTVVNLIK